MIDKQMKATVRQVRNALPAIFSAERALYVNDVHRALRGMIDHSIPDDTIYSAIDIIVKKGRLRREDGRFVYEPQ